MALDPRIPLGVQAPPQQTSPLELYSQILQIQNQRENLSSLAAQREANTALVQQRIAENQRVLQGRSALVDAIRESQTVDPDTGERSTDHAKVINTLALKGFPELSESWSKMTTSNAEALEKLESTRRNHGQQVVDAIGSFAGTINSRQEFDSALGILASPQYHAITGDDAIRIAKRADEMGPDGWQTLLKQYGELTSVAKKRREKLAEPTKLGAGEKLIIPGTGQVVAEGEPKASNVNIGSFEDYVLRWAAQNNRDPKTITTADIDKLRETYRLDPRVNIQVAGPKPEKTTVDYWTEAIQHDPSMWNMLANNKPLQQAVQASLATKGVSLNKITAQTRGQMETAKEILPHISTIRREAQELDQLGLMGPIGSRWRDLVLGKVGASELVGGGANGRKAAKFMTDVGLLMTAVARAHGGARGGGSPMMLEHMQHIMGAHGKDLQMFLGNLDSAREWMQGYATQDQPGGGRYDESTSTEPIKVGGFTVKV